MPEVFLLTIDGSPLAKKRPRFSRVGAGVRTFSAQKKEEEALCWLLKGQWKREPLTGPVAVKLLFFMPIAKSRKQIRWHTIKPDLDNLVKFIKDCANGIIWGDDQQVVDLQAAKQFGRRPRTEMYVRPLAADLFSAFGQQKEG